MKKVKNTGKQLKQMHYWHAFSNSMLTQQSLFIIFASYFTKVQMIIPRDINFILKMGSAIRGVKDTIEISRSVNYSHDLWFWETKWHNQMQMRCCNDDWPRKTAICSKIACDYKTKSNYLPNFLGKAKNRKFSMW